MKKPSFQFYPGDWRKDPNLARASLQAKGALIEILCLAFECDPRGYLKTGKNAWSIEEIAYAIGGNKDENIQAIEELLSKNILKKDKKQTIFNARMVRDQELINKRIEGGKLGADHGFKGKEFGKLGGRPSKKPSSKPPLPTPLKRPPSSSSSSSDKEKYIKEKLGKGEESFEIRKDLQLPAAVLESAEINQHAHTKNSNTEFIKSQWRIFLSERIHDPPEKKVNYKSVGDLTKYFLNWVRNKFPKKTESEIINESSNGLPAHLKMI